MFICKLKKLRFNKGVSQKELSEQTGIRYPTISEMERCATRSCSIENLDKLCRFFNCTLNDIYEFANLQAEELVVPLKMDDEGRVDPFVDYTESNKPLSDFSTSVNDDIVSDQVSVLVNIYKGLDPIKQAELLIYASKLKKQSDKDK